MCWGDADAERYSRSVVSSTADAAAGHAVEARKDRILQKAILLHLAELEVDYGSAVLNLVQIAAKKDEKGVTINGKRLKEIEQEAEKIHGHLEKRRRQQEGATATVAAAATASANGPDAKAVPETS